MTLHKIVREIENLMCLVRDTSYNLESDRGTLGAIIGRTNQIAGGDDAVRHAAFGVLFQRKKPLGTTDMSDKEKAILLDVAKPYKDDEAGWICDPEFETAFEEACYAGKADIHGPLAQRAPTMVDAGVLLGGVEVDMEARAQASRLSETMRRVRAKLDKEKENTDDNDRPETLKSTTI